MNPLAVVRWRPSVAAPCVILFAACGTVASYGQATSEPPEEDLETQHALEVFKLEGQNQADWDHLENVHRLLLIHEGVSPDVAAKFASESRQRLEQVFRETSERAFKLRKDRLNWEIEKSRKHNGIWFGLIEDWLLIAVTFIVFVVLSLPLALIDYIRRKRQKPVISRAWWGLAMVMTGAGAMRAHVQFDDAWASRIYGFGFILFGVLLLYDGLFRPKPT